MSGRTQSSSFRPDIEGLRGIAVLLVVGFHCGVPGFSGGFIGVDVFFVLSGYLITGLLVAEIQKNSRLNLLQFYARRIRRLLPASALTLFSTLVLGAILLSPNELTFVGRAGRATALYMSNIFFGINAADYFAPSVESNPMLHTWSLAVEEQFYLFWPLLIMAGLQFFRSRKMLFALLSGLTVVSLGVSVWFTASGGTFAFYQLPARAWEFGLGGLAVLPSRGTLKLSSNSWFVGGWLGVLTILGSGYYIVAGEGFPGWIALVPVIGTIVVLVAGVELQNRGVGAVLNLAPLQRLGTLSYSWYLWHWPFLVFSMALFPSISIAGKIAAATASLALAALTHRFVENPIRFHPFLVERPSLAIYLAGTITLCSFGASTLSMQFADQMADGTEMKKFVAAVDDISRLPRQQCVAPVEGPAVLTCVFGDESAATHIVLFGDSHAVQWFNPLQRLAESHGWRLTTIVKSSCPATDLGSTATSKSCAPWRAEAIQQIVSWRPSLVFIGNAASMYVSHKGAPKDGFGISLQGWQDGTRRTLQTLTDAGLRVAIIRDNPLSTFDVPTCLARSRRHSWYPGGSCEMVRSAVLDPAIFEADSAAAQDLQHVHFVDLTDQLCDEQVCHTVQNGEVMYRDNNYLTGRFADRLTPALEAKLLPILKDHR